MQARGDDRESLMNPTGSAKSPKHDTEDCAEKEVQEADRIVTSN